MTAHSCEPRTPGMEIFRFAGVVAFTLAALIGVWSLVQPSSAGAVTGQPRSPADISLRTEDAPNTDKRNVL